MFTRYSNRDLSHFTPALILILLAFFFMLFPGLAAFLVILGLFGFGLLYALVVYKMHRFRDLYRDQMKSDPYASYSSGSSGPFSDFSEFEGDVGRPTFKTITLFMTQRKHWFSES